MRFPPGISIALVALRAFLAVPIASSRQEPQITAQQMCDFLRHAEVVRSKTARKGVTGVARLTLSDGKIARDASFQTIDEKSGVMQFPDGRVEMNFRASYGYNIAAYELAVHLGLGDVMPVAIDRKYQGRTGSSSWWLPVKIDES